MKYDITYTCGHTATIELFGPNKDREKKIEWYKKYGLCPECYAKAENDKNAISCTKTKMLYREYKNNWYWCKTERDSYDKGEKTINVYIPEVYEGLEDMIGAMVENGKKMSRNDAYKASFKMAMAALEAGEITEEQVRTLADIANKIRN